MDEHDFLVALRSFWMTQWVGPTHPELTFFVDDEVPPLLETSHLRVTIRTEGGARVAIGRLKEETRGLIMVEVFTPRNLGPGVGERLASDVAQVWRAFRHIRIRLPAPSVVGLPADGAFNRYLVTLGWRGDMRLAA